MLGTADPATPDRRSVSEAGVGQGDAVSGDLRSIDTQGQEDSIGLAGNANQGDSQALQDVVKNPVDVMGADNRLQPSAEDAWAAIDTVGSLPNSFAPISKPIPLIDLEFEIAPKPLQLESIRQAVPT